MPGSQWRDPRTWRTWSPWLVVLVVVTAMVLHDPSRRTVTGAYREGVAAWWAGTDMYGEGIHGFLYLPASALVFTPFTWLGHAAGDALWRAAGLLLLVAGVRRLARRLGGKDVDAVFFFASLLAIPGAWSAVRNGQANVHVAALVIHAALDVGRARWGRAALLLALGLAIKPIALVPILLFAALAAPMRWRLAVGVTATLALPFLFAEPATAWMQYERFVDKMRTAGAPPTPYTNLFGGLEVLGLDVPDRIRTAVRAVAAIGTLFLCLHAWRRHGRERGALAVLGYGIVYLMLFNPRTEANSYVMLAALTAPMAAALWIVERRRAAAAVLGTACVLLGSHSFGDWIHQPTKRWLKPALTLGIGAFLARRLESGADAVAGSPSPAAGG